MKHLSHILFYVGIKESDVGWNGEHFLALS